MISPELIAGMLFMPSMERNEAIEIIGCERFSYHKGLVVVLYISFMESLFHNLCLFNLEICDQLLVDIFGSFSQLSIKLLLSLF